MIAHGRLGFAGGVSFTSLQNLEDTRGSRRGTGKLPDQGSNLDSQYQKLMCYHYTIGQ